MNISKEQLVNYGFKKTHTIEIEHDGILKFKSVVDTVGNDASIYLWLGVLDNDEYEVLYVGKAGNGVARRFSQHMGGFTNSNTGRSNRKLIEQYITSGKKIVTFARISENHACFGVEVSAYSTEEEAMCKAFEPLWNRAKFPSDNVKSYRDQPISNLENHNAESVMTQNIDELDFSDAIGLDEFKYHLDSVCQEDKLTFYRIIKFINDYSGFSNLRQKIVKGYSGQLSGYNNIPMLVITEINENGRAKANEWALRIPLISGEKITIILNEKYLKKNCPNDLIIKGNKIDFSPRNLSDFLNNPSQYVNVIKNSNRVE